MKTLTSLTTLTGCLLLIACVEPQTADFDDMMNDSGLTADAGPGPDTGPRLDADTPADGSMPAPSSLGEAFVGELDLTMAELGLAFARLSACLDDSLLVSVLPDLDGLVQLRGATAAFAGEGYRCVAAAETCADALACVALAGPECEPNAPARCEGDVVGACGRGFAGFFMRREDCAANPSGNTQCATWGDRVSCVAPDPCDADEAAWCDGDRRVDCVGMRARVRDCGQTGQACVLARGRAECAFESTDAPCSRCDGDTRQGCDVEGNATTERFDCGTLGLTCDSRSGQCVALEPACTVFETRCTDDAIEVCYGGAWWVWDCAAAGATCVGDGLEMQCAFE